MPWGATGGFPAPRWPPRSRAGWRKRAFGDCISDATDAACAKPFEALALDWKVDGSGTGVAVVGKTQKVLKAVTP